MPFIRNHSVPKNCFTRKLAPLILTLSLAPALLTNAAGPDEVEHPGYVEGSQFLDYIDPDGTLIEVNLSRRLIKLFSGRAIKKREPLVAEILDGLVSFKAVVGDIDARTQSKVQAEMNNIRISLDGDEWERFVRVREDGNEYTAFIHIDKANEELIDGLLVMGFTDEGNRHSGRRDRNRKLDDEDASHDEDESQDDGRGRQMIFVNLAGTIDMENIAMLGDHMGMPVLKDLPPISEVDREQSASRDHDDDENGDEDEDLVHSQRDLE